MTKQRETKKTPTSINLKNANLTQSNSNQKYRFKEHQQTLRTEPGFLPHQSDVVTKIL